jgi:MFS transporter, FSR family, fosmidomycin resistance protein
MSSQTPPVAAASPSRKGILARVFNLKALFHGQSKLLPLFMVAHFGHHVVGALLSPVMPMIRDEFGLDYTKSGVLTSVFSITGGIAQLPAGWLADRIGTRPMILVSVTGVAIGGLLIGLSPTYGALMVLLGLTALMTGGYHPASASAISAVTRVEARGRALGLHLIGGTSSFWVTMLVVAPMAAAWGWRVPYIVLSIPVMILGVIVFFAIGRRAKAEAKEQAKSDVKMVPDLSAPAAIRWRVFLPFIILTVGTGMIMASVGAYYNFFARDQLHVSTVGLFLLMAISPFVGVFIAPLSGYLSDKFGPAPVVMGSALLSGPLLFAMSKVSGVPIFALLLVFIGVVNMSRGPSAEAYFVTQIPAKRRATILGIYFLANMELAGLMTPLAGKLLDAFGFATVLTWAAIAQVVLAIICSIILRGTAKPVSTPAAS